MIYYVVGILKIIYLLEFYNCLTGIDLILEKMVSSLQARNV